MDRHASLSVLGPLHGRDRIFGPILLWVHSRIPGGRSKGPWVTLAEQVIWRLAGWGKYPGTIRDARKGRR